MDTSLEWNIAKDDLPVDTRQEEKSKTATIMEEPSDGVHEEQKLEEDKAEDKRLWRWEWMDASWMYRS